MNPPEDHPEDVQDLIDDYLDGSLDEKGLRALADRLRSNAGLRHYFVRYCRLHTDLHLDARAQKAGDHVLRLIDGLRDGSSATPPRARPSFGAFRLPASPYVRTALAAVVALVLAGLWWWFPREPRPEPLPERAPTIAWLLNAQDCEWEAGLEPAGDLVVGKELRLRRGLAELCFRSGARVVLEGPADLVLLSANSAEVLRGRITARVPESAKGFTIQSPRGQVIDLGTEFGVSVADDGSTDVLVFKGQVEALAGAQSGRPVDLKEDQAASLGQAGVVLQPGRGQADAGRFVRVIKPPPVVTPRTLTLDFRRPLDGTIRDAAGLGTGLTHRLPGTGQDLPAQDPNLRLNREAGRLELTTTRSDLNEQVKLSEGEYPGVRLSDLGFTGTEDFSVTVDIPYAPVLEIVDQFGLYAGVKSDKNIRGGFLRPGKGEGHSSQFIVENNGGSDSNLYEVGLVSIGDNLRLTLQRVQGKFSLMVENRTTGLTSTLAIAHPEFLDGEQDVYVGLFGATPWRDKPRILFISEFRVTVWTRSPDADPRAPGKNKQE